MSDDIDNLFEQHLRSLLAKTEDVAVPPLTSERLEKLRALIPASNAGAPLLSLIWKRMTDGASEILSLARSSGLTLTAPAAPALRGQDGQGHIQYVDTASLALPDGELLVQILPGVARRAKLLLSVRGKYAEKDDLSVELSLGARLIEARPLEQKAEFTLIGTGHFTIVLLSGEEAIGRMELEIGETGVPDNDG